MANRMKLTKDVTNAGSGIVSTARPISGGSSGVALSAKNTIDQIIDQIDRSSESKKAKLGELIFKLMSDHIKTEVVAREQIAETYLDEDGNELTVTVDDEGLKLESNGAFRFDADDIEDFQSFVRKAAEKYS